ncbi:MAG: ribonuclease E [Buchnera aphidicola (Periphyllus aceris)]|nr:ribonuclease E [Buchnera aphidicola (Periphyllus aceris)]
MKKMFINVSKEKNIEIAIMDNKNLYHFFIEKLYKNKKNNIYFGKVKNVELSLDAIFIDYGYKKSGFLPFKNIYKKKNKKKFLVQIIKEKIKNKRVLLTTFICFYGLYVIIILNKPNIKKISKKIIGTHRDRLKTIISLLKIPKNMGIILRTTSKKKNMKELQLDCDIQIKIYKNLKFTKNKKIDYIQKKNIIFTIIRNIIIFNINKIIINNLKLINKIKNFLFFFKENNFLNKIKYFKNKTNIFDFYKINFKISKIFKKKVNLISGSSLIFDCTDALTIIDVNSSNSIKGKNFEETAFNTNLESLCEIIKQIRIRDFGGIIIIDFINMSNKKNKKKIEFFFKKTSRKEFSKITVGKISKFGLLEISRQKLYTNIEILKKKKCNKCFGTGKIFH